MTVYFIKPIVWNSNGYKAPSGEKFTSGFPKDHGFGHEEWNNSQENVYTEQNGEPFCIFHTEGLGNLTDTTEKKEAPIAKHAGDICIFMCASHMGQQYLVGMAQRATYIYDKYIRLDLAKQLNLSKRWKDAWKIEKVRQCNDYDENKFRKDWEGNVHWVANWKCPANDFTWFTSPIPLNPVQITGKKKLIGMYSRYQKISEDIALEIIREIDLYSQITDINEIIQDNATGSAEKQTLITARLGQGKFRQDLMKKWNNQCAISDCKTTTVLRASHIKPWRHCATKGEKLDPFNGLILSANFDALFDKGLISFEDNGEIKISPKLAPEERTQLQLCKRKLRIPLTVQQRTYLSFHRDKIFLGSGNRKEPCVSIMY